MANTTRISAPRNSKVAIRQAGVGGKVVKFAANRHTTIRVKQ